MYDARDRRPSTLVPVDGVVALSDDFDTRTRFGRCENSTRDVGTQSLTTVLCDGPKHQLSGDDDFVVTGDLGGGQASRRARGVDEDRSVNRLDAGPATGEHRVGRQGVAVAIEDDRDDTDHRHDRQRDHRAEKSTGPAGGSLTRVTLVHRRRTVVVVAVAYSWCVSGIRRWLVWMVLCTVLFGAARAVALPEVCANTTSAERRAAITEGVGWIARTQQADGRFLYRYDAIDDRVVPGYVWIRHAGTMMALAQVVETGLDGNGQARQSFERALDAALREIVHSEVDGQVRAGLGEGSIVSTGGSALLLLALTEGDVVDLDLVDALGRHIAASVVAGPNDTSVVLEVADRDLNFAAGSVSRFTTGEVAYALARLERRQPGRGWGESVPSILDYLALYKADREGFVPDMADHWAAYAMGEMTKWTSQSWMTIVGTEPGGFDDVHLAWAEKQMGMSSVMVRYEAQRTNRGLDRWLRGRTSVGSAIGTHGESLGGWYDVALAVDGFSDRRAGLQDRLRCNAGVITARQIDTDRAAAYPAPDSVRGSWLWFETTQVDDQQHAVSALVAAERILDAGGEIPRRESLPHSWWLVALAVVAVVNPGRLASANFRLGPSSVIATAGLLLADRWLLRILDVSVPTAIVAAGVLAILGALVGFVPRLVPPTPTAALWRPEVVVLLIASGGRPWALVIGLALSLLLARSSRSSPEARTRWLAAMWSMVAVVAGIVLIVDGVYSV